MVDGRGPNYIRYMDPKLGKPASLAAETIAAKPFSESDTHTFSGQLLLWSDLSSETSKPHVLIPSTIKIDCFSSMNSFQSGLV